MTVSIFPHRKLCLEYTILVPWHTRTDAIKHSTSRRLSTGALAARKSCDFTRSRCRIILFCRQVERLNHRHSVWNWHAASEEFALVSKIRFLSIFHVSQGATDVLRRSIYCFLARCVRHFGSVFCTSCQFLIVDAPGRTYIHLVCAGRHKAQDYRIIIVLRRRVIRRMLATVS